MKKIVLVLTLIFAAGIIAASAQTSAKTEKQKKIQGVEEANRDQILC